MLSTIPFSKRTEQISLFNNKIENPREITSLMEELPYLKALWVQGNPVVENCVNFTHIGEYFPQLEIINSRSLRVQETGLCFSMHETRPMSRL